MSLENQFAKMLHSEFQEKKLEETMNELSVDELADLLKTASVDKLAVRSGFVQGMLAGKSGYEYIPKAKQVSKVMEGKNWTRTMSPKERLERLKSKADAGGEKIRTSTTLSPEAKEKMLGARSMASYKADKGLNELAYNAAKNLKAGVPQSAASSTVAKKPGFFSGLFKSGSAIPVEVADYWGRELAHSHMQKVALKGVGEAVGSLARTLKGVDPNHRMLGGALLGLVANKALNQDSSLAGDAASLAMGAMAGRGAPGALAQLRRVDPKGFGRGVRKGLRGGASSKAPSAAPTAPPPSTTP